MFLGSRHSVIPLFTLLLALTVSCRAPQRVILNDPAVGYLYDPKTADAIEKGAPSSQQLRELNAKYRTALAEPVTVVAWEKEYSDSEIFFATNRKVTWSDDGTAHIGSAWGQELFLGTCRVTLPRRERGQSADPPKASVRFASMLPGFVKPSAEKDAPPVAVGHIRSGEHTAILNSIRQSVERAPEHDLLIFVHGFNVDFLGSTSRAAQIAVDLPFNGAVIAYSWPSQGGVGNYSNDEQIVLESVAPFMYFLEQLNRSLDPETRIHIVVHSMGNRLVLNSLSRLPDEYRNPPRFDHVVLAAPDVGVSDFLSMHHAAASTANRTTLYVNASDTALIASKGVNHEQRIGDAFPPIVVSGVETVDASAIDTSFMGHSYYGSNRRALSDMFALIKENRGANQRAWLRQESTAAGPYWVFASQPAEIRWVWYFDHLASSFNPQPRSQLNGKEIWRRSNE